MKAWTCQERTTPQYICFPQGDCKYTEEEKNKKKTEDKRRTNALMRQLMCGVGG